MTSRAVIRLMKDAKELSQFPVPNASATPLDENLLVWHANVTASEGQFAGVTFHLHLHFPENYPSEPPKVDLCTALPHPNIFPNQHGCKNYICLDVLEGGEFGSTELKDRPYTGWSSSYTVSSLMVQIAAFLMDDRLQFALSKGTTPSQAIQLAKSFRCGTCQHTGSRPFPPLSSKRSAAPVHVVCLPQLQLARKLASMDEKRVVKQPLQKAAQPAPKKMSGYSSAISAAPPAPVIVQKPAEWETVTYKKVSNKISFSSKKPKGQAPPAAAATPATAVPVVVASVDVLASAKPLVALTMAEKLHQIELAQRAEKKKAQKEARAINAALLEKKTLEEFNKLTPAQQKRRLRQRAADKKSRMKKKEAKALNAGGKTSTETSTEKTSTETVQPEPQPEPVAAPVAAVDEDEDEDGFSEVKPKEQPKEEHVWSSTSKTSTTSAVTFDISAIPTTSMGNFKRLPYQMILNIMELLPLSSLHAFSMTCRSLHQMSQDGVLWQALFRRHYPHSQLTPHNMNDWKRLFSMEVDQIFGTLVCFHTKVDYKEDVLGIPIQFTVNPRTEQIDYVYSSLDILSRQAYYEDKVRKTVWKEKFTHFLPIYIDEDHFRRGLPILKRTMAEMCGGGQFEPSMVLYILPKLMNTMVVLLVDRGIHASQKALDGYWTVHRLFIALVREYPQLSTMIDKKIQEFIKSEGNRVKSVVPSLGDFLPLLSVSDKVKWKDISWLYLAEVFDRNVLWVGKADASLVTGSLDGPEADTNRLTKTFDAIKVSNRLTLFHVHFLNMNAGKTMDAVATEYDLFYGRPSHMARSAFQKTIGRIIEAQDWPAFFSLLGLGCPTPLRLTQWLKTSVKNSLRKSYHTSRTNFSAIQKSGVSSILKKGETYKSSSQLKKIKMEESWGYEGSVRFLDASCIMFSGTKRSGYVDYAHTRAANGAVNHSGDVIDYSKNTGTHTINVTLTELPEQVDSLWFTMTAFTGDLTDIKQPFVRFTDASTDEELCRYDLESVDTGTNLAIIMCSMNRLSANQWSVKAIGHIGMGKAGSETSYAPLFKDIEKLIKN